MEAGIDEEGSVVAAGVSSEVIFQVNDFVKALSDSSEILIYDTLVTSNQQKLTSNKVPTEAIFIDWKDVSAFTYKSAGMDKLGAS